MKVRHNHLPKAVQDCHELLEWIIPQLDKFPRQRRYTLGERIETGLLEVLEWVIDASYSRNNRDALARANRRLDVVRHLWRLGHSLKAVSHRRYAFGAEQMTDLGRQIGGWRRASA